MTHNFFSYGTLQQENVQTELFGRTLTGTKDALKNYEVGEVQITDVEVIRKSGKDIHLVLIPSNNPEHIIEGTLFEITDEELAHIDEYEVQDYKRVMETFESGKQGWVYVLAN